MAVDELLINQANVDGGSGGGGAGVTSIDNRLNKLILHQFHHHKVMMAAQVTDTESG